jgi:Domain of unknown function (DUF4178)
VLAQDDDLVRQRVRWLRNHSDEPDAPLADAIEHLERALDQRTDLLVRGHEAPIVAPAALLRAPDPGRAVAAIQAVAVGDAVSHGGVHYLVEGVATPFADGQTWKLAHLVPSTAGATDRWLAVAPGGLEIGWLESIVPPLPGARQLPVQGSSLPLDATRTATAS